MRIYRQARSFSRGLTGQALQRDVVHDLVVAALQEGRVDGRDGNHALARQARRKRHGVLRRARAISVHQQAVR